MKHTLEVHISLLWLEFYTAILDMDICFVRHPRDEMSWVEQIVPWEPKHRSATCMPYESQQDTQS